MYDIGDALVLVTGKVLTEPCALPGFRSKLQLDKLFNGFWASIKIFVSWIYVKLIALACSVKAQA